MAKKTKKTKELKLEDILFNCRNLLRGRAPMQDKRDLLLTLVFFKFIGSRFEEQQNKIREEYKDEPALGKIMLDDASSYEKDGIFYLKPECRWSVLSETEPKGMAVAFDNAITILDNEIEPLKNAFPRSIFTSTALEPGVLRSVVDEVNKIDGERFKERDLIGRVYEYFLQAFSINADKEEGEFYTPESIVKLMATILEPWDGTLYDPCCGSGGMFVQSAKFVELKQGDIRNINVYGQESEPSTFRLAKMNLAVRGISYDIGTHAASTFTEDQHPDLRVPYIMANPPFNLKNWYTVALADDYRWKGYGLPPASNANYAWILHILSKMDVDNGIAGFLLANGALEDQDTLEIRKKLIQNDKVEAIIVLPRNMFYSTDISVTLWILNNNKRGGMRHGRMLRDRTGKILFLDLRTWNQNVYEKKYIKFSDEQIAAVHDIYTNWQTSDADKYEGPELYRSVKIDEIEQNNWSLVPSRYIEFIDRDTEMDYDKALTTVASEVKDLLEKQRQNSDALAKAFKVLGYGK